jgi:hypothetical protein
MFYPCDGPPTRREEVKFRVKLTRAGIDRHAETLSALGFKYLVEHIREGDTGYADYTVNIDYFGDVVRKLELFGSLLDDESLVTEVDFEELSQGRSVIAELAEKITRIQDKLALKRFLDNMGGEPVTGPIPEPEPEPEPPLPPPPVNEWKGFFAFLRDWWDSWSN